MEGKFDQAQGLRAMQRNSINQVRMQNSRVKVITVTGGKGGVGKSNVSLNLAVALAAQGKKVMLLDADLGLANIDVMLGLRVEKNLFNVLNGECTLDDIIITGPYGLMILPATSGTQAMVELTQAQHAALIRAFGDLKAAVDVLIVDTAAGISNGQELFAKLTKVTERFLDASLELVSCIPYDTNVKLAVRKQQVIVDAFPKSPAAIAFRALASRALTWPIPYQPGGHLQFFIENMLSTTKEL